jgi:hypothetical protein
VVDVDDARPLNVRNSDDDTIATVAKLALAAVLWDAVRRSRRGFVSGRNFLGNVVEADGAARSLSCDPSPLGASVACFDFGVAFPSVAREYLLAILQRSGLPERFAIFVMLLYAETWAFATNESSLVPLFCVSCGVLQGARCLAASSRLSWTHSLLCSTRSCASQRWRELAPTMLWLFAAAGPP